MTSHSKPKSSDFRSIFDSDFCAAKSSSSCSSFSARTNSPADSGLKQSAAAPADFSPSSASSVMRAVEIANRRSLLASLSFFRPKRTSVKPN